MKKSERLNQELIFLSGRSFFRLQDLMTEFGISKRTALRDLEGLELLGLPFYVEKGRYGGYHLINQKILTPVYFNQDEIEAIFFALKALALLSSTPFEQSYAHIRQKLLATIPENQQQKISQLLSVIDYHSVPPVKEMQQLRLILHAILEGKIVHTTNTQHHSQTVNLQMAEIFYRNGIWFCEAYDIDAKQWGVYRCDYLVNCSLNEEITENYSQSALKKLQQHHEKTFNNIPFRCQLTEFGKELFLKNHYPNMRLEIIADKSYIVGGYNQAELGYMTHYLISLGKNVVVEYPEALKESVLADLKWMMEQYQSVD